MIKNKNKVLLIIFTSIIYISTVIYFTLVMYGYKTMGDECSHFRHYISGYKEICNTCGSYLPIYSSYLYKLFPIAVISLSGFLYGKVIKLDDAYTTIFYGIIPLILFLPAHSIFARNLDKNLNSKKCIVTKAVIYDRQNIRSSGGIKYSIVNKEIKVSQSVNLKMYKKTKLNDTILIRYDMNCIFIIRIYKLFPTREELEKCKNDCYLIDGKLIEKN